MVKKEFYRQRNDGVNLYKIYSSEHLYIKKIDTDEIYDEVIDVENAPYEYEETNEEIINEESEE